MSAPFLLVTGFGGFEDVVDNPSGELALRLGRRPDVTGIQLPVSFARAPDALEGALAALPDPPAGILSMGVHPGSGFRIERQARAELSSDRPDMDGEVGTSLGWSGAALETGVDVEGLAQRIEGAGAAVSVSMDAGRYVCECVFRQGLLHGRRLDIPALFLHVPPIEVMPTAEQLPVVELVVQHLLEQARR